MASLNDLKKHLGLKSADQSNRGIHDPEWSEHINRDIPDSVDRGPFTHPSLDMPANVAVVPGSVKPLTNLPPKDSTMLTPDQVRVIRDKKIEEEKLLFAQQQEDFRISFRASFNQHMSEGNDRLNSFHVRHLSHHVGCTISVVDELLAELEQLGWIVTKNGDSVSTLAGIGFSVSLPKEEK
jgi:hypothetical protein